jgi:hypothetical protein
MRPSVAPIVHAMPTTVTVMAASVGLTSTVPPSRVLPKRLIAIGEACA